LPQQEYTPNLQKKINATTPSALKGHFPFPTTSVVGRRKTQRPLSLHKKHHADKPNRCKDFK
jgi:hypothetical protein